jgi:hypothetical protein
MLQVILEVFVSVFVLVAYFGWFSCNALSPAFGEQTVRRGTQPDQLNATQLNATAGECILAIPPKAATRVPTPGALFGSLCPCQVVLQNPNAKDRRIWRLKISAEEPLHVPAGWWIRQTAGDKLTPPIINPSS